MKYQFDFKTYWKGRWGQIEAERKKLEEEKALVREEGTNLNSVLLK